MTKMLLVAQVLISFLLMTTILLQHRGTGLGGAFASESNIYRSKRGAEKFLFYSTIIFAFIFVVLTIINTITK